MAPGDSTDRGILDDVLCEHFERTVCKDNYVQLEGLTLQIPADRRRCHDIKLSAGLPLRVAPTATSKADKSICC